jgi:hypothetical protein
MDQYNELMSNAVLYVSMIILFVICLLGIAVFLYMFLQWFKHRNKEKYALDFVTLLVALPKDNEIKIDAAEQMFASLHSLYNDNWFAFLKTQDHIGFEIVALKEEIKFYINVPRNLRDLVEKQIHGAYPGARIEEHDEVNIFSEQGKVAFAALKLKKTYLLSD